MFEGEEEKWIDMMKKEEKSDCRKSVGILSESEECGMVDKVEKSEE